jgi:hypothetical protein
MEKMLDAGFCLPAIGFAFRRGGRGYWFLKVIILTTVVWILLLFRRLF